MGVVSLALWALVLVVTVKYVLFLMRADNKGDGGVLSLMALAQSALGRQKTMALFHPRRLRAPPWYLHGDGVITPAISVLFGGGGPSGPSRPWSIWSPVSVVLIASLVILVTLFAVQARGTAKVAVFFGPIMVVWFAAIAIFGVGHIIEQPRVLLAISPSHLLPSSSSIASHAA